MSLDTSETRAPLPGSLQAQLMEARETIGRLQEENALLREVVRPARTVFPPSWGLTRREAHLLTFLATGRPVTKAQLYTGLYFDRPDYGDADIHIIDVYICKIRRKLDHFGIKIGTIWGSGYEIDRDNLARLKAHLAEAMAS